MLRFVNWCWRRTAWVALFESDDQAWYVEEAPLLASVVQGNHVLAPGLFGTALGVPPWGTLPEFFQIAKGRRMLARALPFTDEMLKVPPERPPLRLVKL